MKFSKLLTAMFFLISLSAVSQSEYKTIQLLKGDSPIDHTIFTETPKPNKDIHVTGVKVPAMELYIPDNGKKNKACVVICPGGGYQILSYIKEGRLLAEEFNKNGIAAAVLRYRLPAEKTEKKAPWIPLLDAQLGIQYLKQNAKALGLDKGKIGIMGFSAGGHLAGSASTLFNFPQQQGMSVSDIRPDFSLLIYPVITTKGDYAHMGSRNNLLGKTPSSDDVNRFNLNDQVTTDTPPTFLLHAKDDNVVPIENSRLYRDACVEKKVPVVLYELNAGGHGFGLGRGGSGEWFPFLIDWMKKNVE